MAAAGARVGRVPCRARERGASVVVRDPDRALVRRLPDDARRGQRGHVHAEGDPVHRPADRGRGLEERDQARGRQEVLRAPEPARGEAAAQGVAGGARGRDHVPDLHDDARPVGLPDRTPHEGVHPRADRRRRHEERDRGQARRPVRPGSARRAAEEGLQPARLGAAVRRPVSAARSSLGARWRWRWSTRPRAVGPQEPRDARARRSSGAWTRSSPASTRADVDASSQIPAAFLAGVDLVITPCVLPLVPGYLSAVSAVEADRLGEPERRGASPSRACRSSSASRSSSSCSATGAAALGGLSTTAQLELAGFVLVVLGLAFIGLLPWPERLVAPGLLRSAADAARASCSAAAFAVCAAPCIGAGARVDPRARRNPSDGRCRGAILLASTRGPRRSRSCSRASPSRARWARSAGCATTTT